MFCSLQDIDGVSDSRRVRVRSQIAEEQLVVLKQHYALNPRPKREELEIISQRVGFPVRVVQVWFQNNRARDRREGRFVPIPYAPAAPYPPSGGGSASATDPYSGAELSPRLLPPTSSSVSMDQPLDLSTKRSTSSSPASSPYPYDSDECGAVNLSSRKSPLSAHLLQQHHHQMALATLAAASTTSCCPPTTPPASSVQQLTAAMLDGGASYRTSPTPPPLTPEKRLMPYNHQRTPGTPNSANSIFFSMERIVYTCNASHSPVTSSSPIYNGSCSPNSSDSWKPVSLIFKPPYWWLLRYNVCCIYNTLWNSCNRQIFRAPQCYTPVWKTNIKTVQKLFQVHILCTFKFFRSENFWR